MPSLDAKFLKSETDVLFVSVHTAFGSVGHRTEYEVNKSRSVGNRKTRTKVSG